MLKNVFFRKIVTSEIFRCLQQIHGNSYETFMLSKLIPVVGNICDSNLGLDEASTSMIADDVDIIVNSAANTNFHERFSLLLSNCFSPMS